MTDATLNAHSITWVVGSNGIIDIYANAGASAETIGGTGSSVPDMQVHLTNAASLTLAPSAFILHP